MQAPHMKATAMIGRSRNLRTKMDLLTTCPPSHSSQKKKKTKQNYTALNGLHFFWHNFKNWPFCSSSPPVFHCSWQWVKKANSYSGCNWFQSVTFLRIKPDWSGCLWCRTTSHFPLFEKFPLRFLQLSTTAYTHTRLLFNMRHLLVLLLCVGILNHISESLLMEKLADNKMCGDAECSCKQMCFIQYYV